MPLSYVLICKKKHTWLLTHLPRCYILILSLSNRWEEKGGAWALGEASATQWPLFKHHEEVSFNYMNMLSKVHKILTFFLPVRLDRTNIDRGKEWGDLDGSKHCFVGDGWGRRVSVSNHCIQNSQIHANSPSCGPIWTVPTQQSRIWSISGCGGVGGGWWGHHRRRTGGEKRRRWTSNFFGDGCDGKVGDGHEIDCSSDSAGAADDGMRGGWKDAGVFGGEMERGREMWLTWWM